MLKCYIKPEALPVRAGLRASWDVFCSLSLSLSETRIMLCLVEIHGSESLSATLIKMMKMKIF